MSNPQPPTTNQSPFDQIRHEDAQGEFWLARELALELGYKAASWHNFEMVLAKAKKACENSANAVADHFYDTVKMIPIGKGATREIPDVRLTRYACYLIAQNGDSEKEVVAKAQTYFAVMTRDQEVLRGLISQIGNNPLTEVAQRIEQRMELTEAHKDLMRRARDAGVITPQQCARFMNWGYKGLYSGEAEDDIHARKGLSSREAISDWMSAKETMANVLRAVIAEKRMERQGTTTVRDANKTHFDAGRTVRGWLASEGILPEELPRPTKSYQQIVREEYARIQREEEDARGLWGQLPAQADEHQS